MTTDQSSTAPEIPVLDLVEPLPGFPGLHRFALVRLDDAGVVCELRSLEEPDLRFVVVPPSAVLPEHATEIDDSTAAMLAADTADDLLVLLLVSTAGSASSATVNLRAPLVVNHRTRRAAQVVLRDESLPVRAPLRAAAPTRPSAERRVR